MVFDNNLDLLLKEQPGFKGPKEPNYKVSLETSRQLDSIVSKLEKQNLQYKSANLNTAKAFQKLLDEFKNITGYLKETAEKTSLNPYKVFYEIDSDRSVGILSLFWHSVSFTTRGNISPRAINRKEDPPLIAGRIIALKGDFHDAALELHDQEFPELIASEIGSLFIPYDPNQAAIARFNTGDIREITFNQEQAPAAFLLKIVEIVCTLDDYHEEEIDFLED